MHVWAFQCLMSEYINMCIVKSVSIKSGINTVLMMTWEWCLSNKAHTNRERERERDIDSESSRDRIRKHCGCF